MSCVRSKTVGIIASGPSASIEDAAKLRSICDEIIAVNDAWRLCKEADHLYATDMRWFDWALPDLVRDFNGQLWTQRVQWSKEPESLGIGCFESECKPGLCTEPNKIYTGSNSGYAAINVAWHFGARTVYLLGYDMGLRGGQRHFFTDRPEHLNVSSNYDDFINKFRTIDPAKYGLEIINLSRQTRLVHFPLGNIDELAAQRPAPPEKVAYECLQ